MNESFFAPTEHQGYLKVSGRDAAKFLQGYVTCDMEELAHGEWRLGAICNLQGRMVTSFRIANRDGEYLLNMARELVPVTLAFLGKYIPFFKARMDDVCAGHAGYGIAGPDAGTALAPLFAALPAERAFVPGAEGSLLLRSAESPEAFELWLPAAQEEAMRQTLAATLAAAPASRWTAREIAEGLGWVTAATSEEFVPQMMNLEQVGGISFTKGCYLGQEIVARMQYRGQLKRRMVRGGIADSATAKPGDAVLDEAGKRIGVVVAAAARDGGCELLAVVQHGEETPVCCLAGGIAIAPLPLPYSSD